MRRLILQLDYDSDTDDPVEYSGWKFVSFNRRHRAFVHPDQYFGKIGFTRKLQVGTAFVLSCYSHSGDRWSLYKEGMQCQFDTAQVAGLLIWTDPLKHFPKSLNERRDRARGFLDVYNEWANGSCYWYCLSRHISDDVEPEELGSCGGFIGDDDLWSALKSEHFRADDYVRVEGDAKDLAKYADLSPAVLVDDFSETPANDMSECVVI